MDWDDNELLQSVKTEVKEEEVDDVKPVLEDDDVKVEDIFDSEEGNARDDDDHIIGSEKKCEKGNETKKGLVPRSQMQKLSKLDKVKELCQGALLTDELKGELCRFNCPDCRGEWKSWVKFRKHKCQEGTVDITISEMHKYISKAVAHECRICGTRILCDAAFTSRHMFTKHNIRIAHYRREWLKLTTTRDPFEHPLIQKLVREATSFSDQPLRGQCQFDCPKCGKSSTCWAYFQKHMCMAGRVSLKSRDLPNFITKVVVHQCKICSYKVLCDSHTISKHMHFNHQMSVPQYCKTFEVVNKSEMKLKKIIENARVTDEIYGQQCKFFCGDCKQQSSCWGAFKYHQCREGMAPVSKENMHKYIKEAVVHECRVCKAKILADSSFLLPHLSRVHKLTHLQYQEQYSCKGTATDEKRAMTKGTITDEIGNFCLLKCGTCPRTFNCVASRFHHMRAKKHGSPSYKIENQDFVKLFTHKCKLCSALLLCINYNLERHFRNNHQGMTITEYCQKTNTKYVSGDEEGIVVSDKAGNFCEFQCIVCTFTSTLDNLRYHKKKAGHNNDPHAFMNYHLIKKVMYHCKLCDKQVLCDWAVIRRHTIAAHGMSQIRYCEQVGEETESQSKLARMARYRKETEGMPTFPVQPNKVLPAGRIPDKYTHQKLSNTCLFKCQECGRKNIGCWPALTNHRKRVHKLGNCFKPDSVQEARYHKCAICSMAVLADVDFICRHLRASHKMNQFEYVSLLKTEN